MSNVYFGQSPVAAYELSKASSSFFCCESKKERSLLEQPNNQEVYREEGMKERTRIEGAPRDMASTRDHIEASNTLNHLNKLKRVKELKKYSSRNIERLK